MSSTIDTTQVENLMRLEAQFPHFANSLKIMVDDVACTAANAVNGLVGDMVVTPEMATELAFEEITDSALEFLRSPYVVSLIADTSIQVAEYFKENYFIMSDVSHYDLAREALRSINSKKDERLAGMREILKERMDGSSAEDR